MTDTEMANFVQSDFRVRRNVDALHQREQTDKALVRQDQTHARQLANHLQTASQ